MHAHQDKGVLLYCTRARWQEDMMPEAYNECITAVLVLLLSSIGTTAQVRPVVGGRLRSVGDRCFYPAAIVVSSYEYVPRAYE